MFNIKLKLRTFRSCSESWGVQTELWHQLTSFSKRFESRNSKLECFGFSSEHFVFSAKTLCDCYDCQMWYLSMLLQTLIGMLLSFWASFSRGFIHDIHMIDLNFGFLRNYDLGELTPSWQMQAIFIDVLVKKIWFLSFKTLYNLFSAHFYELFPTLPFDIVLLYWGMMMSAKLFSRKTNKSASVELNSFECL